MQGDAICSRRASAVGRGGVSLGYACSMMDLERGGEVTARRTVCSGAEEP